MVGIKVKPRNPSVVRKEMDREAKKKQNADHKAYKKKASDEMKEMNKKRDQAYEKAYRK